MTRSFCYKFWMSKNCPTFIAKPHLFLLWLLRTHCAISLAGLVPLIQCMLSTLSWTVIDYLFRSGRMCAVRNWWIFAGHLIQNIFLKLLYVIDALLAVLVIGAGCWTLCGCSMGGLSGSIWSAGCHTHTQVSLSGSGLNVQKLLYASSNTSVLISPNRNSWTEGYFHIFII